MDEGACESLPIVHGVGEHKNPVGPAVEGDERRSGATCGENCRAVGGNGEAAHVQEARHACDNGDAGRKSGSLPAFRATADVREKELAKGQRAVGGVDGEQGDCAIARARRVQVLLVRRQSERRHPAQRRCCLHAHRRPPNWRRGKRARSEARLAVVLESTTDWIAAEHSYSTTGESHIEHAAVWRNHERSWPGQVPDVLAP